MQKDVITKKKDPKILKSYFKNTNNANYKNNFCKLYILNCVKYL